MRADTWIYNFYDGVSEWEQTIALFTVNSAHLHCNKNNVACMRGNFGYLVVLARNCLASMLDFIVMQMRKINRKKGQVVNIKTNWGQLFMRLSCYRQWSASQHCQSTCRLQIHLATIRSYFDNVMTKFMITERAHMKNWHKFVALGVSMLHQGGNFCPPKQWNSSHVIVSNQPCGNWTICIAAGMWVKILCLFDFLLPNKCT